MCGSFTNKNIVVSLQAIFWKGARVVEEARLESVYTSQAYHGFESRPFREVFHNVNFKWLVSRGMRMSFGIFLFFE